MLTLLLASEYEKNILPDVINFIIVIVVMSFLLLIVIYKHFTRKCKYTIVRVN